MLARDFACAHEDLVDAVRAIVRARRQNVAALEVDDLDDAVVLEPDRAGELLASQLYEPLDEIDFADLAFKHVHPPSQTYVDETRAIIACGERLRGAEAQRLRGRASHPFL